MDSTVYFGMNTEILQLGSALLEFQPRCQLSWFRFFLVFVSASVQMLA